MRRVEELGGGGWRSWGEEGGEKGEWRVMWLEWGSGKRRCNKVEGERYIYIKRGGAGGIGEYTGCFQNDAV